jgi:hypothetical protein
MPCSPIHRRSSGEAILSTGSGSRRNEIRLPIPIFPGFIFINLLRLLLGAAAFLFGAKLKDLRRAIPFADEFPFAINHRGSLVQHFFLLFSTFPSFSPEITFMPGAGRCSFSSQFPIFKNLLGFLIHQYFIVQLPISYMYELPTTHLFLSPSNQAMYAAVMIVVMFNGFFFGHPLKLLCPVWSLSEVSIDLRCLGLIDGLFFFANGRGGGQLFLAGVQNEIIPFYR